MRLPLTERGSRKEGFRIQRSIHIGYNASFFSLSDFSYKSSATKVLLPASAFPAEEVGHVSENLTWLIAEILRTSLHSTARIF